MGSNIHPTVAQLRSFHLFIFVAANGLDANEDPKNPIFISLLWSFSPTIVRKVLRGAAGFVPANGFQHQLIPEHVGSDEGPRLPESANVNGTARDCQVNAQA